MPPISAPGTAWLTPFPAADAAQNRHAGWPRRPLRACRAARPSAPPIASRGPKSAPKHPKSTKTAHRESRRALPVACGPALRPARSPNHPGPGSYTESTASRQNLRYAPPRGLPGAPEAGAADPESFRHDIRLPMFRGYPDPTFCPRERGQMPVRPTVLKAKRLSSKSLKAITQTRKGYRAKA